MHVPSLNERMDDIPLIANYFLKQICEDYNMPVKSFTPDALEELKTINWTGNIRELRNVIERLIILCDKTISGSDVGIYAGVGKQMS